MTPTPAQRLHDELLALNGLVEGAAVPAAEADGTRALARSLMAARQADAEAEPCPAGARHRAYALLAARGSGAWSAAVRLVFDSWASLAPAARHLVAERLLRFRVPGVGLDLELARDRSDGALTLAIAVEGALEVTRAAVVVGSRRNGTPIRLDEHGTGSVRLGPRTKTIVLVLEDEDGEVLRTPPLDVGAPA